MIGDLHYNYTSITNSTDSIVLPLHCRLVNHNGKMYFIKNAFIDAFE